MYYRRSFPSAARLLLPASSVKKLYDKVKDIPEVPRETRANVFEAKNEYFEVRVWASKMFTILLKDDDWDFVELNVSTGTEPNDEGA